MTTTMLVRRRVLFLFMSVLLGSCGAAGDSAADGDDPGSAAEELVPGTAWPGFITRTVLLSRDDGGRQVRIWREERWENFRVSQPASRMTAGLDADWTLTERVVETSEDCVYRREARGTASYPWFMFDLDPFTELEYRIYSGGSGDMSAVEGTMHGRCRNTSPPESSVPYETLPSWLPAVPFEPPPEYRIPGLEPMDPAAFGPAIAGRLDPDRPDLVRGQYQATMPEDGSRVILTWNLDRAGECDEAGARARLREQAASMSRALAAAAANAAARHPAIVLARWSAADTPLSAAAVTGALQRSLGADHIQVTPGADGPQGGLVKFGVRLGADGRILPSLETIQHIIDTTCVAEGSFDGARTILAGAVQWTADGSFRVTMRTFAVETGVVRDTVSETGRGDAAALGAALQNMILNVVAGGLAT